MTHLQFARSILLIVTISLLTCQAREHESLRDVCKNDFYIGVALGSAQINGQDPRALELTARHFNAISPENCMKFGPIHPKPDVYYFETADNFVEFGEQHDMFIIGHNLVWHSQTAPWLFKNEQGEEVEREVLIRRMQEHISTVVGRYKGRVHGWDVVNEALNDDGTLRQTKWLTIIGEDYLQRAFELAHNADPEAELYYNDYDMYKPARRDGAIRLVKSLLDKGVRIDAIGMQGHWGLDYPKAEEIEASIEAFAALGVKVMITELDISVLPLPKAWRTADVNTKHQAQKDLDPFTKGLPDSMQQKLAARYAELFDLFVKHRDEISRVTFWGTHDGHSWKNNFPVRGRTDYPLLFDRNYQPKPAFHAVLNVMRP